MANKKGQNENILTIPAGTVKIEDKAYKDRTDITGVVIPDTVTEIGEEAFSGCTGLTSVTIPASVKSVIPKNAFQRKTKIIWSEEDRSAK